MIRVCHIVNLITGKSDGVYAHLKMIFSNSDKEKFQHYLIFQGGRIIENELSDMGVKFYVSESLKKKISIKAFLDVYRFIKENDISIMQAHLIKPYAIVGLLNLILRKKFIFNHHGLFIFNNVYYGIIEKIIYGIIHFIINIFNAVDVVLVPSGKSKELLLAETKLFPEPIVYYNGYDLNNPSTNVNPELYDRINNLKEEKKIVAVIGRLEIDKRIDKAIKFLKNIKNQNSNIQLLIFGNGNLENDLKNLVKELELSEQVNFFGYVDAIINYYKLFDVVLFTSEWEGMPLVMWEAMANKVPVLAPDVGGFGEILEKNNCGIIYPPENMEEAEEKLIKLIEDDNLRKELGKNGSCIIVMKFNSENFIRQIEDIYFKVMRR